MSDDYQWNKDDPTSPIELTEATRTADLRRTDAPKKVFGFSLWKFRYVFRYKPGPFLGTFLLEIERGPKRWY